MKRLVQLLFVLAIITWASAWAACDATISGNSTVTAVNTAINARSAGQTLCLTATTGTQSWSGTVTMKTGVAVVGSGMNSTLISGGSVSMATNSKLIGFGFTETTVSIYNSVQNVVVGENRFVHSGGRTTIIESQATGSGTTHPSGVIYGNIFDGAAEVLHMGDQNTGTYNASALWYLNDPLGALTNVLYVEDNTWNFPASGSTDKIVHDGNYGGRFVFRFNTVNNGGTEHHGIQTYYNRGVSHWEYYHNTYNAGSAYWLGALIRDGSTNGAVFFNNTFSSGYNTVLGMDNQTSYRYGSTCQGYRMGCDGTYERDGNYTGMNGYPCRDQVGRGRDTVVWSAGAPAFTQTLSPAYFWNNTRSGVEATVTESEMECVAGCSCTFNYNKAHLGENRDYYQKSTATSLPQSTGVRIGTRAEKDATTCTPYTAEAGGGPAFWVTDEGFWNSKTPGVAAGVLYRCSATNTWTLHYVPGAYPHPLRSGLAAPTGLTVE